MEAALVAMNVPAATAATISTVFQVVSTGMQVLGGISRGSGESSAARYNAQIAQQNAVIAQQQAAANAEAQQRQARMKIGAMAASRGASGVGMEGSFLDVVEQSAAMAELDRQNILYQGNLKARGYQNTAGLELMRGKNAATSSYLGAGTALLSGAAKMGAFGGSDSDPNYKYGQVWGPPEPSYTTAYSDDYWYGNTLRRDG